MRTYLRDHPSATWAVLEPVLRGKATSVIEAPAWMERVMREYGWQGVVTRDMNLHQLEIRIDGKLYDFLF